MGFKDFLMKKMLQSKMKDVPPAEQEKILAIIQKNPEFFQKIGAEIQEKIGQEKDQMSATLEVMQKYGDEMKRIMGQ